ncbi:Crustacean neurohormone [Aphelenchoides avenae]|nr:Crustacean neurohormone [Aphelenchus avenae]
MSALLTSSPSCLLLRLFVVLAMLTLYFSGTTTAVPLGDDGQPCNIHQNEALHAVMDRVCELCHDMYSHQNPNLRSQCRSNCFQSGHFKKCLHLFKPARSMIR